MPRGEHLHYRTKNKDRMPAVTFDKMCLLSGLIWNRLADREEVSWRVPYVPAPGIHGHGPMLQIDPETSDPPFIVDFLKMESLELGLLAKNIYSLVPKPRDRDSRIRSVKPVMEEDYILGYVGDDETLTDDEMKMANRIGVMIESCKADEVRVLAVHSGVERTIEAIEYNVSFACRLLRRLAKFSTGESPATKRMLDTLTQLANELKRKTGTVPRSEKNHRILYERARAKALGTDDDLLREIIHEVCPPANGIWNDTRVVEWQSKMGELLPVIAYVRGLVAYEKKCARPDGRPSETEKKLIVGGNAARILLTPYDYNFPDYETVFSFEDHIVEQQILTAVDRFIVALPKPSFPDHWDSLRTGS